jgi:uncharacterized protein YdeI (YjbR/CyaY-like superfamily)
VDPTFFETAADFRAWLEAHHEEADELWVGLYKRASGRASMTWPEAVDQALCFGWIDGVRKSIDELSYANRFTPRRPRSHWSAVNVRRVDELKRLGLMHPAGVKAFEARSDERTATYSYEQRHSAKLEPAQEHELRANKRAWEFFQAQAPWYRRVAVYWVVSAKREETRRRRLAALIAASEQRRPIGPISGARKPRQTGT